VEKVHDMEAQLPRSDGGGLDTVSVGSIRGGGGLEPVAAALDQAVAGPPRFGSDDAPSIQVLPLLPCRSSPSPPALLLPSPSLSL
jgi:hypothetical protein